MHSTCPPCIAPALLSLHAPGLVDVVLDSAASGQNTVEREGISIVHPAKFIMIGGRAVAGRGRVLQGGVGLTVLACFGA